jgi:hypothetical protein
MEQAAQQAPDVRASITAAIAELEKDEPQTTDKPAETVETPVIDKPAEAVDELVTAVDPLKAAKQDQPAAQAKPAKITDTPARPSLKAPVSWKPEIREKWTGLPPEVQAEVIRREREIQSSLQNTASMRQFAEAFASTIAPYRHIIALEGDDPLKTFSDYMRTATMLRTGSPMEKASSIASAIMQFGVDINMLDQVLQQKVSGQGGPIPQLQQSQQSMQDPRVDEILGFLRSQHEAQSRVLQTEADEELYTFANDPKHEFLEDVRHDMADLLQFAAARGRKLSLEDAYKQAVSMNPELSKIVQQRAAAAQVASQAEALAAKRAAASTVVGSGPQQTGKTQEGSGSVRESIEAAIAKLSG